MDLLWAILILVLCYYSGSITEKRHYKSIRNRELKLYKQPYISFAKKVGANKQVKNSFLVSSSVVLGCDHFKAFIADLKGIFGGNISAYESVLDRGRREAILRIRESAKNNRADVILNVKIDTIMLDPLGASKHPKVCVTAYGTAVEYAR